MSKKKIVEADPVRMVAAGQEEEAEPVEIEIDEIEEEACEDLEDQIAESVVYLGPNIDKVVNHGTVFEGGILSEALQAKIDQVPAIKGLIVPISKYAEVALEVATHEGRFKTLYDIVNSKTKKEGR